MRICLQLLVLVGVAFCLAEARKKDKWMTKSKFVDYHHGKRNDLLKHGEDVDTDYHHKKYKHKGRGEKHMGHHGYGGSMKHHKKGKSGHKKHMAWLNIRKDSDCGLTCKHGEVCITGPIDTKPLCVHKKDLKKSLKLFRRYQKKEMKAWSKFHKERYHHDYANYPHKSDEKFRKEDSLAALKKQYMEKHHEKKERKHELKPFAPPKPDEHSEHGECTTSQFSQMRTRMMGWFHLLHAQDHLAKKAHGKHTKHFYKHVSVKKELREHDGKKCECLKSAMWQFHQMDKNSDDHLNDEEIAVLGENSLEPCLKPYLTSCDHNADGKFSSNEWCCCFSNVVAPCFKKVDEIRRSGEPVVYMPRCDREGYYMREQCSGDSEDTYKCWCVDYNGNEYKGTYTHGRAHCHKIAMYGVERAPVV